MNVPELITKAALRQGLSIQSIKTYKNCVRIFLLYYKKDPKMIKKKDITDFLDYLVEKKATGSTVNVYLCALKFFYQEILHKRLLINIRFSRITKRVQDYLTKEEMKQLISSIENSKHALIIKLTFSTGMRVNEVVNLRPIDFHFEEDYGWIRKGKGNKDRPFIIAKTLKKELQDYIDKNCPNPNKWLFPGQKGHLSVRTVQMIVKKARISKNVHPHTLRHTFATHVIFDGNDICSTQLLMGHTNIETTMRYVHANIPRMMSVQSPLDTL